jgi:hypothetical protein
VSTVCFVSHIERLMAKINERKPNAALDKGARNRIEEMLMRN